jgi:CheY-like chemotaxis protein
MSVSGRILVLDDSEVILSRVRTRLIQAGYEVVTASQAADATRNVAGVDMVLIDLHMPGVGGADALTALRKAAQAVSVQPLFFLYTSDKIASSEYRTLGFDGAIINKGDDESLVQQLAAALRFAKLRRLSR